MSAALEGDRDEPSIIGFLGRGVKTRRSARLKPCERCKSQHLRCIYHLDASKCQRCERAGRECVKRSQKLRFRDVPVFGFRNGRAKRRTANISEARLSSTTSHWKKPDRIGSMILSNVPSTMRLQFKTPSVASDTK